MTVVLRRPSFDLAPCPPQPGKHKRRRSAEVMKNEEDVRADDVGIARRDEAAITGS
ncbi:hypothetical protein [Propionivibrio dicarboxylicus]|uniref:hypothetical protein n=1 Tax=Propionivibrio dicarboxylicus TaxID=83767 RepID=UPI00159FBB50|nr:hypothetical protein [Propionivibrio dicarboxylicus]